MCVHMSHCFEHIENDNAPNMASIIAAADKVWLRFWGGRVFLQADRSFRASPVDLLHLFQNIIKFRVCRLDIK